jgi:hypothetical protein
LTDSSSLYLSTRDLVLYVCPKGAVLLDSAIKRLASNRRVIDLLDISTIPEE